eukprot:330900-Rhodomonas_salina.3
MPMVQSLKVVVGGLLASCGATYALRPTPQSATVSVVDVHSASSESTARERFLRDGAIVLRGGSTEKMISHMEPLLRQNPRFDGRITLKAGFRESSRGERRVSSFAFAFKKKGPDSGSSAPRAIPSVFSGHDVAGRCSSITKIISMAVFARSRAVSFADPFAGLESQIRRSGTLISLRALAAIRTEKRCIN